MFEAAMGTARTRQGSRNGADANVAPPDTKRSYVLRSSVVCHLCDGRMFGKTRHGNPYYSCQPGRSRGSIGRERDPNHPPTVYVREEALLDGILRFFGDRIFGPTRQRQGPMGQIREKSQKDSPCLDRRSSGFSRGTGRPIPTKTGRGLSFSLSSAARTAPDDALPLLQDLSADDELVYQPHREQVDRAPTQRAAVSGTQRVGCRFLESKEAPAELLCPMQAMAIPLWALTSCGRRISLVEGERDHDADLGDLI